MRLIEKDYYTLGEVVAAWEMPRYDVAYLAETGRMRLSVRVCRTHIERGLWKLEEGQGWAKVPEERARYTGLVDLKEQDAHLVFRDGGAEIATFHTSEGSYCHIEEPSKPVAIFETDLLLRADERRRLEQGKAKPDKALVKPPFTHDASYEHVEFCGRHFRFGRIQASIVRQLHEASDTPMPWRRGEELLEVAESGCYRLVDVFKSKLHWRELIHSDNRGAYRLAIPPHC